jgi:hypothetical protein
MNKFLQILSLVFVLFGLAKCQPSINRLNKTVASSLSLSPRQFCDPQSLSFIGESPSPNFYISDITSQLWSSQGNYYSFPGYTILKYRAWSVGGTGYVEMQSQVVNGIWFRVGKRPYSAMPTQNWTQQAGILPAIPSQTTTSQASFDFNEVDYYVLEIQEVTPP